MGQPNHWNSGLCYFLGAWVAVGNTAITRYALASSAWTLAFPSFSLVFSRACSSGITTWKRPEKCRCYPQLPVSSLAPSAQPAWRLSAFLCLQMLSHSSLHRAAIKTTDTDRERQMGSSYTAERSCAISWWGEALTPFSLWMCSTDRLRWAAGRDLSAEIGRPKLCYFTTSI